MKTSYEIFVEILDKLKTSNKVKNVKHIIKEFEQQIEFYHIEHRLTYTITINTKLNYFQQIAIEDENYSKYNNIDSFLTTI
jgi:hypothetical protein